MDLALGLEHVCSLQSGEGEGEGGFLLFSTPDRPEISIHDYVLRLRRYGKFSPSCFLAALIYLDRIRAKLNYLNVHRLLATATLLAAKFMDDWPPSNRHMAQVAGVDLSVMNRLEREFLRLIDFDVSVDEDLFRRYGEVVNIP